MGGQLHLNKGLHGQPYAHRVDACGVILNISFALKPLFAATRLTCRQVQPLAQLLRRELRVVLQGGKQIFVSLIQHYANFARDFFQLWKFYAKNIWNARENAQKALWGAGNLGSAQVFTRFSRSHSHGAIST